MSSLINVYSGIEIVEVHQLMELNQPIDRTSALMRQVDGFIADITGILLKYSATNMDQQYYLAVRSTITMCDELNTSSEELYQCQMAISNLMQKLAAYEEVSIDISSFSLINFHIPSIDVNQNTTIFVKQEMIYVHDAIGAFCNQIAAIIVNMQNIPDEALGWRDNQKAALRDYINDFTSILAKGCQALLDYQNHLYVQIHNIQ